MTKHKDSHNRMLFAKIKENRILDDQNNFLGQIDKDFIYIFSKKRKEFFAVKHMKQ